MKLLTATVAVGLASLMGITTAHAAEKIIDMHAISEEGVGDKVGTVTAYDSDNGLVLRVELSDIPPGPHGFHVHENPSCEPAEQEGEMVAGASAGGHYDPEQTGKHRGPSGDGHLGDLPVLFVEEGETSFKRVQVAPRLKVSDLEGRALIIHSGGDNYRDTPEKLGGGGSRIACGVIE